MVNNLLHSFLLKFCKLLLVIIGFLILRWWSYMLFMTFVEMNNERWPYLMIDKLTVVEVSKLIKMHGYSIISKLLEVLSKFIKWWLHFIDSIISKLLEMFSKFIDSIISKLLEVLSKFIKWWLHFIDKLLEVLIIL